MVGYPTLRAYASGLLLPGGRMLALDGCPCRRPTAFSYRPQIFDSSREKVKRGPC